MGFGWTAALKRGRLLALVLIATWLTGAQAWAAHVALVVGNAAYRHEARLKNPHRDAERMRRILEAQGFAVEVVLDADKAALEAALSRLSARSWNADTAVFYYSGHGIEIGGENFLIPVNARLQREQDARFEAVRLQDALYGMSGATRLQLAFIDACRNNSFLPTKGGTKGMTRQPSPSDRMLISFATQEGQVAQDGAGDLSPYTQALAELLEREPQAELRTALTTLGQRVQELAGAAQRPRLEPGSEFRPGEVVSLTGRTATVPPPAPPPPAEAVYSPPAHLAPQPGGEAARLLAGVQAGNAEDMNALGLRYQQGRGGLPQDDAQAKRLYEMAIAKGNADAMYNLGFMYLYSQGVALSYVEARRLFARAAALGHASGREVLQRLDADLSARGLDPQGLH